MLGVSIQKGNFKNLTVDYPIQSIEFYAHKVFPKIKGNPKVTFLRQETSKERLSAHHREMDIPILLEWDEAAEMIDSDGIKNPNKAIIIFAIEAESSPIALMPFV